MRTVVILSRLLGLSMAIALVVSSVQAQGQAPDTVPELNRQTIPNSYIVVFNDDTAEPKDLARDLQALHGFQIRHQFNAGIKGFTGWMPPGIANILSDHPDVAYVEQSLPAYADVQTTPTGVLHVEAHLSPTANIDNTNDPMDVDVVVIDTGIDLDHPQLNVHDLDPAPGIQGKNFLTVAGCAAPANPGDDDHSHGTHVAGTIGAIDDDANVVGVAPGARVWAYKVLCANGSGDFADVVAAIADVISVDQDGVLGPDAEVINLSLSGIGYLQSLRDVIRSAVSAGIVVYVAASNETRDIYGNDAFVDTAPKSEGRQCLMFGRSCKGDTIPAAYPEVGTISAIDDANDTLASFSNYSANMDFAADDLVPGTSVISDGAGIDLAAPGVGILSTNIGGGTISKNGTSMASPHAAGAAALYIVQYGRATDAAGVYAIRQAIVDHAEGLSQFVLNDKEANNEALLNANFGPVAPPSPNVTPQAANDNYNATEDVTLIVGSPGVLQDDSDGDSQPQPLTAVLSMDAAHGDLALDPNGGFTYQPDPNFNGQDSFTYHAYDGQDNSNLATVTIDVAAVNDAPTADNDSYDLNLSLNSSLNVAAPGVLYGDEDVDGDSVTAVAKVSSPTTAGGSVTLDTDGSFSYTPPGGLTNGQDSFTYVATDTNLNSNVATVTINVTDGVNGDDVTLALSSNSTNNGRTWDAEIVISVTQGNANGEDVVGIWSAGGSGQGQCMIGGGGCSISLTGLRKNVASVTFTIDTIGDLTFDGDTQITVLKP